MEIPMILFLIGSGTMLYSSKARHLFVLLAPLGLTAGASYFRLYPFDGRMLLFSLPAVILLIGEGIAQVVTLRLPIKKESFLAVTATKIILVGICLVLTGTMINSKLVSHDEIKPVLEYVQTRQKEGDKIYLYYWAEPAFRYYAPFYGFNFAECKPIVAAPAREIMDPIEYFRSTQNITPVKLEDTRCILGTAGGAAEAMPEFEKLKAAGRIWFIFSFFGGDDFVQPLEQIGTQLDKLILFGASAYLYDL
jgi:hypothetical protein